MVGRVGDKIVAMRPFVKILLPPASLLVLIALLFLRLKNFR